MKSEQLRIFHQKELDKLLGLFYCKVRSASSCLYEPSTLTSIQKSLDRHLTKDLYNHIASYEILSLAHLNSYS